MHYTIEKIMENDLHLFQWYSNAKNIWKEIFAKYDPIEIKTISELAKELEIKQGRFERECGGRWIGQEIMVVSGLTQFYSTETGFDVKWDDKYDFRKEKARNLYDAFQMSWCSIEVKGHARDVARSYGLEKD